MEKKRSSLASRVAPFLTVVLLPICFFPLARDWGWWQLWTYLGLTTFLSIASRVLVAIKNPDLIRERANFTSSEGIKEWDKILVKLVVYAPLLTMLVATLDQRFGWQPPVPAWAEWLGLAGIVLGYVFSTWAMIVNRFFSSVVRIQTERGHAVCSSGPYRVVRHPGYAGSLIGNLGMPLLFGSWWAFIPALLALALVVTRTVLEDRTLQAELPGYSAYAARVRYRLLPGIW